jgi:hypothetical protein
MVSFQSPVYYLAIATVTETFLSRLKGEVSPNNSSWRQEPTEKHVGAKVHMMVTIKALGFSSIKTNEFVSLGVQHIFEGAN